MVYAMRSRKEVKDLSMDEFWELYEAFDQLAKENEKQAKKKGGVAGGGQRTP